MIGNWFLKACFGLVCVAVLATNSRPVRADEPGNIDPLDWPHWRGPEMNGISRERGLPSSWSPEGENLLWKRPELATRSTPIVMNGKLYVLCRYKPDTTSEGEKVVCADAATGEMIWENSFNVFLTDAPAERVAWSCVTGDPQTGNVYALGLCSYFQCLDGTTGKTIWSHSMSEEYGMLSTYGGRTNTPLIFDDLVIISGVMTGWGEYAVPAHRFVAFDKKNGQAVWISSTRLRPTDTTYSSPILANFNGQMAMVFGSGDGSVYAMQPRTGKVLWNYDVSMRGINTTPLVVGNTVYCGHAEENVFDPTIMGAIFALDGTGSGNITKTDKQLWMTPQKMLARAAPILVNDRLYIADDSGALLVVDPKTGAEVGKKKLGRSVFASPLYADGKIYFMEASGMAYILEPTDKELKVLSKQRLEDEFTQGSPIVSHGRLYISTIGAMYCIGNKDQPPVAADPRPPVPPETPWKADLTPAHLQITPVESLLRPKLGQSTGQIQSFGVRLFNANGRYLDTKTVKPVYELKGPGKLEPSKEPGKENQVVFTPAADAAHSVSFVTAKVGNLTSTARIRTVPNIVDSPWNFDFTNGKVPDTWIGSAYRHIVLDDDLLNSLKMQNPRAGRMYIYLTTAFTNASLINRSAEAVIPPVKFVDAGTRQGWTDLLRYFDLTAEGKPATIDEAKQQFDASLELLAKEKVIEKWDWSQDDAGNLQLTVQKGSRGITGNAVMCKISTIPKGTRSQGWMGQTYLHDYTIQADVRAAVRNDKLPAMGVINQRYTLALEAAVEDAEKGAGPGLQIRSWVSRLDLRFAKSIPFGWKYDVWYTMKFQSENKDDGKKVTLRGKVWPRGEAEPAEWTIEATDETPNVSGSPGLFGNATDAEVFVDNVKVNAN
jgi:outer membrane protein assembly factor BamB